MTDIASVPTLPYPAHPPMVRSVSTILYSQPLQLSSHTLFSGEMMCFIAKTCDQCHFGDLHLLGQIHSDIKAEIFLLVLCPTLEGAHTPSTQGLHLFKGWSSWRGNTGPPPSLCMDCHFLNTNMAWLTRGRGAGFGVGWGQGMGYDFG